MLCRFSRVNGFFNYDYNQGMKKILLALSACLCMACGAVYRPPTPHPLQCPMPAGLMLHSYYGLEQTRKLAREIKELGLQTFTYRELYRLYDKGQCAPANAILVSLDDLSGAWLRPTFGPLVDAFVEEGLTLTIGVVAYTPDTFTQNESVWKRMKAWNAAGVEIASHSTHHFNLNVLRRNKIESELRDSYDLICRNLGKCPETFILPFGNGWDNPDVIELSKGLYRGIVGIQGPSVYAEPMLIFRRVPPSQKNESLLDYLSRNFPQPKIPTVEKPAPQKRIPLIIVERFASL